MSLRSFTKVLVCLLAAMVVPRPAAAWVFPEHADLTARALNDLGKSLDPHQRAVLADVEQALGLCSVELAAGPGKPRCPTLATLAALAGDHSCTPLQLGQFLAAASRDPGHWVHGVLTVAARTRASLAAAGDDAPRRADVRRQMHVDLQSVDTDYLERALVDYSHFQATRPAGSRADLGAYLEVALAPTVEANATAAYVNYHVAAVRLAAHARVHATEKREWLARALLAEAFAVHFLEDAFSTGHFVGHWGDDATRLGTHDFYSGAGVEASRWRSPTETFLAHGDAFLSDAEAQGVAAAVGASMRQVLLAATNAEAARALLEQLEPAFGEEQYDSCASRSVPPGLASVAHASAVQDVVGHEPVPAPRFPAPARVRAEKGFFFGVAATFGSGVTPEPWSVGGQLRATPRVGFGAGGIVDDPMNAQAFLELGFVGEYVKSRGSPTSVTGYTGRLRAPGYVCLVDGAIAILLAQALEADCPACLRWASAAAGGGLGKLWRSRPLFGTWSGQMSLLRDVSFNYFRNEPTRGRYRTELLAPVLTARSVLPIAGDGLSQSTDFYLDVGPSLVFSSDHPRAVLGVFASFATATRLFP